MVHFDMIFVLIEKTKERGVKKPTGWLINIVAESVGRVTCNHGTDTLDLTTFVKNMHTPTYLNYVFLWYDWLVVNLKHNL